MQDIEKILMLYLDGCIGSQEAINKIIDIVFKKA